LEDELISSGFEQKFVVTISWSAESDARLTEGDIKEVIESLAMDLDEEAMVDVAEVLGPGE